MSIELDPKEQAAQDRRMLVAMGLTALVVFTYYNFFAPPPPPLPAGPAAVAGAGSGARRDLGAQHGADVRRGPCR